jgi:hypothetical protein
VIRETAFEVTLCYRAGADAAELLDTRQAQDDETFIGGLKRQMDL